MSTVYNLMASQFVDQFSAHKDCFVRGRQVSMVWGMKYPYIYIVNTEEYNGWVVDMLLLVESAPPRYYVQS